MRTGSSITGPDALDEPDVDPHPEHRGHDVREHHGRVDVVAAHRLQGHLRAQLGRMGDIEERVLLADGAIFRKRPARLAHEPHRRPLDFLAPRGAHEKRLAHATRVAPIVNLVGEHLVTPGPLAPRWLAWSLESPRAGTTATARVSLENAGTATWRSHGKEGVQASFHWLDPLGNPIVWDGPRTPLATSRRPRASGSSWSSRSPHPGRPGAYRLAFDLVEENRFWFAEVGGTPLELEVEVVPRIDARTLAVEVHGTPDRRHERCARRAGRAAGTRASMPQRLPISSPVRFRHPSGRGSSSTRTSRAGRQWGRR